MELTIKSYLKAIHKVNYSDEMFQKLSKKEGTGAAGGLVAAILACFDKTQIISGMEFIKNVCQLNDKIMASDYVITGEGSLDDQTLSGKVVSKIKNICVKKNKPIIVLSGVNMLTPDRQTEWIGGYDKISVVDLVNNFGIEKSLASTAECLEMITDSVLSEKIRMILD